MSDDIIRLNKKKQSQLDLGGVLRSAHDDPSQSLRTVNGITEVPSSYSRVELTYNASNSVTRAVFYEGTLAQTTEIVTNADSGGSLNNTYFVLYSENNESKYHVWYNVDNLGTDPAPVGSIGIEIAIAANDSAEIVALATELSLKYIKDFCVQRINKKLLIENSRNGACTASSDISTGFILTTIQQGTEQLLKVIDIPYDGKTRYLYNTQDKHFVVEGVTGVEVDIDADSGDDIAISGHQNPRIITATSSFTNLTLSTAAYTQVLSYTATENLRIRICRIKGDTFGAFRLKVNGTERDYFQTSPVQRNCQFEFLEEERLDSGQTLTIEFLPDRLCITNYDFFMRIESYVK